MYAFFHGSRLVGPIRQVSYIGLLEKNFGKPQLLYVQAKQSVLDGGRQTGQQWPVKGQCQQVIAY